MGASVKEILNGIQAVLFASGEPFGAARLAELFEIDTSTLESIINNINDSYSALPFQVLKLGDTYQMTTKSQYGDVIKKALSFVGTEADPPGNVVFNTEYYGGKVKGKQFAWCVVFVWYCFRKSKASKLFFNGKKTAAVKPFENGF